jgi:hypothetical protein
MFSAMLTNKILFAEESPPKKQRLDVSSPPPPQPSQPLSDTESIKCSESDDKSSGTGANENKCDEEELKETPAAAAVALEQQPSTSSSSAESAVYSSRNDLIRDIESHIEIIFECFDLDDSVSSSAATSRPAENSSADSSTEIVTSSETNREEVVEEMSEKSECNEEKPAVEEVAPAADTEKKVESQGD